MAKGRKTLTENHWPSESRGLSLGLHVTTLTCKTNIVTETVTRNISIPVDENLSRTTTGTSMTVGSQSHQEATCMIREALNTAKTKVRIGFWNVRTMYAAGKLAQVTAEMRKYMCWESVRADGSIWEECEQQQVKLYCILAEKMDNTMKGWQLYSRKE